MATKLGAKVKATEMADSVIALAISKLKEDDLQFDEDLRYEAGPGMYGTITFENDDGAPGGEPHSTNNIVSSTAVSGWKNNVVPPSFCHIVAVGHHHGLTVVRHAMVKKPLFPFSLASAGPIRGEGLEVFALDSVAAAADGITDDEKLPGHIVSNAVQAGESIVLGAGTSVSGDVRAAGTIDKGPALIQGDLLPNSSPVDIVKVVVNEFDTLGKAHQWNFDPSADRDIAGRARYSGNLTVGDITLADGLLYVDGDITITGKITGKGAIAATGNITVTGSMNTKSDLAALVSKKKIKIDGDGPDRSSFQGMLYAEGSISLKDTTILGAAISHEEAQTSSLENVRVVSIPELAKMEIETHVTLAAAGASTYGVQNGGGEPIGIVENENTPNEKFTELSPNGNTEVLEALGAALGQTDPTGSTWEVKVKKPDGNYGDPLPTAIFEYEDALKNWDKYVLEHKNNNVITIDVFKLDLNSLLSLDQNLELVYQNSARE